MSVLGAVTENLGTALGRQQLNRCLVNVRASYGDALPDPAESLDGRLFVNNDDGKLYQNQLVADVPTWVALT